MSTHLLRAAKRAPMFARLNTRGGSILGLVGIVCILLILLWLSTLQRLETEQRSQQLAGQATLLRLTASMASAMEQSLAQAGQLATAASSWNNPGQELETHLAALGAAAQAFKSITLYDDRARAIYQYGRTPSHPAVVPRDVSASFNMAGSDADVHVISSSEPGTLALRIAMGAAHSPAGMLQVELELSRLLPLLISSADALPYVQLLHSDGQQLALLTPLAVSDPPLPPITPPHESHSLSVRPAIGQVGAYLYSAHALSGLPLAVAAHLKREAVLAPQARDRDRAILLLSLLSVAAGLLMLHAVRSIHRHNAALADLKRTAEEQALQVRELEGEKRRAVTLAAHDPLTGLPNRRLFFELAASHVATAQRGRRHCAVLYLDLDRFKEVNDTLGHHVGDLLLKEVAARLHALLRESDVVARLGGDEFAVLLTSLEQEHHAELVAAHIVRSLSEPYSDLDGHLVRASSSVGIAIFGRHARDVETLCRQADAAMYSAKRNGRARYALYNPMTTLADGRGSELRRRLPQALVDDELVLYFHPRVSLYDYPVQGFQAVLRWRHPEHGMLYPQDFLPVVELAGMADAVGDWLVAACCRQLAKWRATGLTPLPLAFSITARPLRDPGFAQRLASTAAQHGISPSLLEVEFTEDGLSDAQRHADTTLADLKRLGLRLTLDDFGTGCSGLELARRHPIDGLKIHRVFIGNLRNSAYDAVTVTSIISMAHNRDLTVVADGVEFLHQLVHLKTARCDYAQGPLFSRSLTAEAATRLVMQPTTLRPR